MFALVESGQCDSDSGVYLEMRWTEKISKNTGSLVFINILSNTPKWWLYLFYIYTFIHLSWLLLRYKFILYNFIEYTYPHYYFYLATHRGETINNHPTSSAICTASVMHSAWSLPINSLPPIRRHRMSLQLLPNINFINFAKVQKSWTAGKKAEKSLKSHNHANVKVNATQYQIAKIRNTNIYIRRSLIWQPTSKTEFIILWLSSWGIAFGHANRFLRFFCRRFGLCLGGV